MKKLRSFAVVSLAVLMMAALLVGCSKAAEIPASDERGQHSDAAPTTVRVSSMKGPTSIGLAGVMRSADADELVDTYEFQVTGAADEVVAKIAAGDTDIALLPANVAATIYSKGQDISVIDINTLGVLYAVSQDKTIASIADLKGKTVYLSGKGTTPDYVLVYLLEANGLGADEVSIEYKSEPTEVAALIAAQEDAVGILPEPYADSVGMKNENLQTRIDLTKAWEEVQGENGSQFVTAVTVVRNDFAQAHPEALQRFLDNHQASVDFVNTNVADAAKIISEKGIIPDQSVAETIIPKCNVVFIAGDKMKTSLEGYLQVLLDADPNSVGGAMPATEFYKLD